MIQDNFRGTLKPLSVADLLEFLRGLNRPGLLSISGPAASVGLYLRAGRIVHAVSSRAGDRLTARLLAWGRITAAQQGEALRRAAGGEKLGRALLETCGLAPRELGEARRQQVREITLSLFEWRGGAFAFNEGEEPPDPALEVDLPIASIIVEGIRGLRSVDLFADRLASPDWVFAPLPAAPGGVVPLERHEEQILRLVDGERSLGAILQDSDYPETETRRSLFLLMTLGRILLRPAAGVDPEDAAQVADLESVVQRYNGLFGSIHRHLMREVGPVAEPLLDRALRDLGDPHRRTFAGVGIGGDGTLDPGPIRQNLRPAAARPARAALIDGLNELLYAQLLVVRRVLGAEHETRLLKAVRRVQQEPAAGAPEA
jgi:hypothetical protein